MMSADGKPNHWELYNSRPGWKACSDRLDSALKDALRGMDTLRRTGVTDHKTALFAYNSVVSVMDKMENRNFGASDTQPRVYLRRSIEKHLHIWDNPTGL